MKNATVTTYEDRCARLADQFETSLDKFQVVPSNDLSSLSDKIEADLKLADYKFKFRQADHVKMISYGPVAISAATFVLGVILGFSSFFQLQQREQDTQASLVLKVLAAPPEEGQRLLTFLTGAGLLKLNPAQQKLLETSLRK